MKRWFFFFCMRTITLIGLSRFQARSTSHRMAQCIDYVVDCDFTRVFKRVFTRFLRGFFTQSFYAVFYAVCSKTERFSSDVHFLFRN